MDYVQEQDGSGNVVAALLKGKIDELFARMTASAISSPLTDAVGSLVAETDLSQTITTSYSYDPYGRTSITGTATGNSLNFGGRENDLLGLYYNRARYYEPGTARFLSQDPLGILAGPNRYAYVRGNPVNRRDPYGLDDTPAPTTTVIDDTGAGLNAFNACEAADRQASALKDAAEARKNRDWKKYNDAMDRANTALNDYLEHQNGKPQDAPTQPRGPEPETPLPPGTIQPLPPPTMPPPLN